MRAADRAGERCAARFCPAQPPARAFRDGRNRSRGPLRRGHAEARLSDQVLLRPGQASLGDWRAIYRGSAIALDPICRIDVEAGSAGLQAILAGEAAPQPGESGDTGPALVELLNTDSADLPA